MEKYLRLYAERETAAVENLPAAEPWQQVVVIPIRNESTGILRPLPPAPGRSLMILVVNQAQGAPKHVSEANRDFAAELNARFRLDWQSDAGSGLTLFADPLTPREVLLVDRFSPGLEFAAKGGVGHARKTGADLAACLIHQGRVRSPWIHCSDADVSLPERYFTCSAVTDDGGRQGISALIYPFRHRIAADQPADAIGRVTQLYEYSLRYYVAGLEFARSPYAFHTIGSTLAVNAVHYTSVRGFPRRQAGEDFYLLNKLAKVGSVRQLDVVTDCEPIDIAARLSDRVPFGTGAATGRIIKLKDPAREFLLYHPGVFDLLGRWLGSLPAIWQSRSTDIGAVLSDDDLQVLAGVLEEMGVVNALHHAFRQSSDANGFYRQMHTWFDAFRTLKLIHYLRDRHLPSISFEALVTQHRLDHLLRHEPALLQLHKTLRKDWLDIH